MGVPPVVVVSAACLDAGFAPRCKRHMGQAMPGLCLLIWWLVWLPHLSHHLLFHRLGLPMSQLTPPAPPG